jgi:hypothetical protein
MNVLKAEKIWLGYHIKGSLLALINRVNKIEIKKQNPYLTDGRDIKMSSNYQSAH